MKSVVSWLVWRKPYSTVNPDVSSTGSQTSASVEWCWPQMLQGATVPLALQKANIVRPSETFKFPTAKGTPIVIIIV